MNMASTKSFLSRLLKFKRKDSCAPEEEKENFENNDRQTIPEVNIGIERHHNESGRDSLVSEVESYESEQSAPGGFLRIKRPLMRQTSRSENCLNYKTSEGGSKDTSLKGSVSSMGVKLMTSIPPHISRLMGKGTRCKSEEQEEGIVDKKMRTTQSWDPMQQQEELSKRRGGVTLSTSYAKLKEETDVLRNIKKRELVGQVMGRKPTLTKRQATARRRPTRSGVAGSGQQQELVVPDSGVGFRGRDKGPEWGQSKFIEECLAWHNLLRARHGVPELSLDNSLCHMAQNWANQLAHQNQFYYQNPKEFGENLLLWPLPILPPSSVAKHYGDSDANGKYVATYWYRGHTNFPYHKEKEVQHSYASPFSQLVWSASRKFGCGKARSSNGKVVVVAYYHPKGNVADQFHLNVVQPSTTPNPVQPPQTPNPTEPITNPNQTTLDTEDKHKNGQNKKVEQ